MKNVLLLSMSVIPKNFQENYYLSIGGKRIFSGISSLEPGTKQILYTLLSKGELLDKIMIIASTETSERPYDYLNNDTVCGFYKKRIINFIKGKETFMDDIIQSKANQIDPQEQKNIADYVSSFLQKNPADKQACLEQKQLLTSSDDISVNSKKFNELLNTLHEKIYKEYISENNAIYQELINSTQEIPKKTSEKYRTKENASLRTREEFEKTNKKMKALIQGTERKYPVFFGLAKKLDHKYFCMFPKYIRGIFENYNELADKYNRLLRIHKKNRCVNHKLQQCHSCLYDTATALYNENDFLKKQNSDYIREVKVLRENNLHIKKIVPDHLKNNKNNEIISDYMRLQLIEYFFSKEERLPVEDIISENPEILEKQIKKVEDEEFFQVIPDKEKVNISPSVGSSNVSKHILMDVFQKLDVIENSNKGESINIYIDTQGGFRNSQQILNSAVEMLRLQKNIHVKQSIGISFNKENRIHPIQDVSEANKMFEMVSGIYEFINYGKAQILKGYYSSDNRKQTLEYPVVNAMEIFSDMLALCSVDRFESSLRTLKEHIINYENKCKDENNHDGYDPLFRHYITYIKKEYEELFDSLGQSDSGLLILKEIRWCLNKKMYMQALTLAEAKMPDFFVQNKIFYYGKSGQEKNKVKQKFYHALKPSKDNRSFRSRNRYKDFNHDFIKYYFIHDRIPIIESSAWDDTCRVKSLYSDGNRSQKWYLISKVIEAQDKVNMEKSVTELVLYSNYKHEEKNRKDGQDDEEKNNILNVIFNEYLLISDLRNRLNHASNTEEAEDIVKYLRDFLDHIEELITETLP